MERSLTLIKDPSAWLPMGLSLAILALLLSTLATIGVVYQTPDGATAQIFNLWLALESSLIIVFGFYWIPKIPKEAQWVMLAQIVLALIPLAIVFYTQV